MRTRSFASSVYLQPKTPSSHLAPKQKKGEKKLIKISSGSLKVNVKEAGEGREGKGGQIMKIVPELDFLNHCMSLFLLIGDNYRILIFFM